MKPLEYETSDFEEFCLNHAGTTNFIQYIGPWSLLKILTHNDVGLGGKIAAVEQNHFRNFETKRVLRRLERVLSSEVCKDGLLTGVKLLLQPSTSKLSRHTNVTFSQRKIISIPSGLTGWLDITHTGEAGRPFWSYWCYFSQCRVAGDPEAGGVPLPRRWENADEAQCSC